VPALSLGIIASLGVQVWAFLLEWASAFALENRSPSYRRTGLLRRKRTRLNLNLRPQLRQLLHQKTQIFFHALARLRGETKKSAWIE
jgi:hypothetical protein